MAGHLRDPHQLDETSRVSRVASVKTNGMRLAACIAIATASLLLTPLAEGGITVWGKIGPFGLGMLQDAVYEQHGFGTSGGPKFFTSYGIYLGIHAPYKSPWRGYTRYVPAEPQYDLYYWRKTVRVGARVIHVYLDVERGKVVAIGEATN